MACEVIAVAEPHQPFLTQEVTSNQPVMQVLQPYVTMLVPVIVNASGPVMPGQAQAVPVAAPSQDYTGSWGYAPSSPEMGPMQNGNFGYDPYTDMAGGYEFGSLMEDEEARGHARRRRRMRTAQPKAPGMIQSSARGCGEESSLLSKERCDDLRQQLQAGHDGLSLAMSGSLTRYGHCLVMQMDAAWCNWPWRRPAMVLPRTWPLSYTGM